MAETKTETAQATPATKIAPPKIKVKECVTMVDAAKILSDIATGLKSGTIKLTRNGQTVSLPATGDVKVKLKACEKLSKDKLSTKGEVKLRLSWES